MRQLLARAYSNVVTVVVAAKLARIARAVMRHGCDYEHQAAAAWSWNGGPADAGPRPSL